jgi:hypothetical protein
MSRRRSFMNRLHLRAYKYFSHLSLFIPDRDQRDESRHAG